MPAVGFNASTVEDLWAGWLTDTLQRRAPPSARHLLRSAISTNRRSEGWRGVGKQ